MFLIKLCLFFAVAQLRYASSNRIHTGSAAILVAVRPPSSVQRRLPGVVYIALCSRSQLQSCVLSSLCTQHSGWRPTCDNHFSSCDVQPSAQLPHFLTTVEACRSFLCQHTRDDSPSRHWVGSALDTRKAWKSCSRFSRALVHGMIIRWNRNIPPEDRFSTRRICSLDPLYPDF